MAQLLPVKRIFSARPEPGRINSNWNADIPAGNQGGRQPEALTDALIRFSMLAWRAEIDTHPPRWDQVQDRIFSELSECRGTRDCQ